MATDSSTDARTTTKRLALAAWRGVVMPLLVAAGMLAIAVALIEGDSTGDFLYAIF